VAFSVGINVPLTVNAPATDMFSFKVVVLPALIVSFLKAVLLLPPMAWLVPAKVTNEEVLVVV
jgi:hypothetical protein